jgi:multidrug transporter EmrE-like cation transporter
VPTTVLILIVTLCTIGSQLILKNGVGQITAILREQGIVAFLIAAATSPVIIGALAIQGLGYVVWLFVLTQSRLSTAFATSGSFFYLVMAAASWYLYGERLTLAQWFALVLISAGVMILNLQAK